MFRHQCVMRNVDEQIGLRELLKRVLLRHPRNNLFRGLDMFPPYGELGKPFVRSASWYWDR